MVFVFTFDSVFKFSVDFLALRRVWADTRSAGQTRPPATRSAEVELGRAVPIDFPNQKPETGAWFLQENEKSFRLAAPAGCETGRILLLENRRLHFRFSMRASARDRADSLPAGDSPPVEGLSDCLAPRPPAGRQDHARPADQPRPTRSLF